MPQILDLIRLPKVRIIDAIDNEDGFISLFASVEFGRIFISHDSDSVGGGLNLLANLRDVEELEARVDDDQEVQDNRLDALEALELKRTPIESERSINRSLDTSFVVDSDRDSYVSYNLRVLSAISASVSPISAVLEISQDGVNFTEVAQASQASSISLGGVVSISLLQDYTTQLSGMVPAGYTVRIRTVGQLPPANTITYSSGHETKFDVRYL